MVAKHIGFARQPGVPGHFFDGPFAQKEDPETPGPPTSDQSAYDWRRPQPKQLKVGKVQNNRVQFSYLYIISNARITRSQFHIQTISSSLHVRVRY